MTTYEGVCRYCGTTDIILAESQEDADRITSSNCSCNGEEDELRRLNLMDTIIDLCNEDTARGFAALSESESLMIRQGGLFVYNEYCDQIQFDMSDSRIKIKRKLDGSFVMERTAGRKKKLEL